MKKLFCIYIVAIAINLFLTNTVAAQDSIKVYDLSCSISPTTNIVAPTPGIIPSADPSAPTQYSLACLFKVSAPASVAEVYIKVGTTAGANDVRNEIFTVVNHSGTYFLRMGGVDVSQFWGKAVAHPTTISESEKVNAKWLTVYVKDNSGNYSSEKYFKIQ